MVEKDLVGKFLDEIFKNGRSFAGGKRVEEQPFSAGVSKVPEKNRVKDIQDDTLIGEDVIWIPDYASDPEELIPLR